MNDLLDLICNVEELDLDTFVGQTKSKFLLKTKTEKVNCDYSWVDEMEKDLPFIDNIIRNPRRFMIPEEEITIVEKTKSVNDDTIKHLAQHTSYIQSLDEDGMIMPSKLLNTYKEETIDLYENRFIFTLVKNIYRFVTNQTMNFVEEVSSSKTKRVTYDSFTKLKNENVKVNLVMESDYKEVEKIKDLEKLKERIKNISDIIIGINNSTFIKNLVNITPVKNPIRKTNIILKDQNFKKALELWEFLEQYLMKDPITRENKEEENSSISIKQKYDLTNFLNYDVLEKDFVSSKKTLSELYLNKIIEEMIKNNVKPLEFKKMLNNEFKMALKKKNKYDKEILDCFSILKEKQETMIKNAIKIL